MEPPTFTLEELPKRSGECYRCGMTKKEVRKTKDKCIVYFKQYRTHIYEPIIQHETV